MLILSKYFTFLQNGKENSNKYLHNLFPRGKIFLWKANIEWSMDAKLEGLILYS